MHTHLPLWHWKPGAQVPQVPPQPSLPQTLPVQLGWQASQAVPVALQVVPAPQVPQFPPHPLLPQTLPAQSGVHSEPSQNMGLAPLGSALP